MTQDSHLVRHPILCHRIRAVLAHAHEQLRAAKSKEEFEHTKRDAALLRRIASDEGRARLTEAFLTYSPSRSSAKRALAEADS